MSHSFLAVAYRIFPFVPAVYALGAYLASIPASRRNLWMLGLIIATILTAFTTAATRETGLPMIRLLVAWTITYALPMVLALATVDGLRRAPQPRWLGVLAVVAVCVTAQLFVVKFVPFVVLGLVEASSS